MDPMLARTLNPKDLNAYIKDDAWCVQQKLDGIRILITVQDGQVTGSSRSGRKVELPDEAKAPFEGLAGLWRFDGEFVGTGEDGQLWLFDMPNAEGVIDPNDPYDERYAALKAVFVHLGLDENPDIHLTHLASTPDEKLALLEWCKDNNAEGVMFKRLDGKYLSGVRSPDTLKAKFTETVDCVILEVGREGKESVSVGAFHNGTLTDIGSVKMTASQGLRKACVGDVIEVRYLYVQSENMRLYQPVFLKFRPDRTPESCTTDQLKYTNKTVRNASKS